MSDSYTHQMEANLDAGRQIHLEDLGETIPCVSLEFFKTSVLPPLPNTTLDKIVKNLKPSIFNGRWRDFPTNPSSCEGRENDVFAKFPDLCDAIMAAAKKELPGKTALLKVQAQKLKSEITVHDTFRVDASAMLLVGKGKHSLLAQRAAANAPPPARRTRSAAQEDLVPLSQDTSDCGWLVELKKRAGYAYRNDNVLKVVGAATHMLFNDPCRRFIFAITIEDTSARFWFFSRFLIMVSKPFNFITEHLHLVHYVVSLGYATEAEIGYDPNMERVLDDSGEVHYDIDVNGVCYRTIKVLDNHRAARAISRATRVWEAQKRDDPSAPSCVLKDVWLGEDADSEKDIQQAIFANMNKVHPIPDFEPDYQEKYFMTILADECVQILGHEDRSSTLIMRNQALPDSVTLFPLALQTTRYVPDSVRQSSGAVGSKTCLIPRQHANRSRFSDPLYEPKQHRRIVFKELGKALSTINDHKVIFQSLLHVIKGLKHLYSAGYVHRDISTGNLLLCDNLCRLSDLEYAKPYDKVPVPDSSTVPQRRRTPQHAAKSGTPAFMPYEIQKGVQCFLPKPVPVVPFLHRHETPVLHRHEPPGLHLSEDPRDSEVDLEGEATTNAGVNSKPAVRCLTGFPEPEDEFDAIAEDTLNAMEGGGPLSPVRHNYLHDLESVWWIAEWVMFTTYPAPLPPMATQIKETNDVFPHSLNGSGVRDMFFLNHQYHIGIVGRLPPQFRDSIGRLVTYRATLNQAYEAFESHDIYAAGKPFDIEPYYYAFFSYLFFASKQAHCGPFAFLPKYEPPDHEAELSVPPPAEPQIDNKEPSASEVKLDSSASKRSSGDVLEAARSKRQRSDTKKGKDSSRKLKRTRSKSKRTRTKSR